MPEASSSTATDAKVWAACRYRLDEQIADGGFGEVWRATDVTLGRTVAVKLLRSACAQDPATLARFRAEARYAAALCHPNIAAIYDFCEPPPPATPFLVLEYVPGPSLATVLADEPLGTARAMRVVADAAAGLAAAHQAGLVHRDIKPSNLLLDLDGRAKITDFGISHAAGAEPLTVTGTVIGTPAYMAPERVAGSQGSAASDIYSLGVVAYHAVSGAVPFSGGLFEVAMAQRERPMPSLPPSVPREIAAFIAELTIKDPEARPADATEVARRAQRLCEQLAAGTVHVTRGPRATVHDLAPIDARRVRHRAGAATFGRWAAVAGVAVGAVMVSGYLASGQNTAASSGAAALLQRPVIPSSSRPSVAAARTVEVKPSVLAGEPAEVAMRQLRALGLSPVIVLQPTDSQAPGTVVSVSPSGRVSAGTHIELTVAATEQPPPHVNAGGGKGHKHHQPHDGGG